MHANRFPQFGEEPFFDDDRPAVALRVAACAARSPGNGIRAPSAIDRLGLRENKTNGCTPPLAQVSRCRTRVDARRGTSPALAQEKLKVAAIYTVPVEQQWVSRIHKALEAAKDRGEIEYVFSENVANADYERVMREYAEKGNTLIVGESFAVEAAARKVAKDYPKVVVPAWARPASRRSPTSRCSTTTSRSPPTSPA